MKHISKNVLYVAIAISLASCGGSSNEKENISNIDTSSASVKEKNVKAKKVFNSMPTPVESTNLLKVAGAKYNPKYLNGIENVSNYSSVKSKALNLGVYGADLSFISIYDQSQESILYLRCTNTLARGLGISGAFDENTTSRIESNMENKDSLQAIISQSFWTADSYLIDNGQPGVSSLIVAGGWIEGLYISTCVAAATKNEGVYKQIGDQNESLGNLISLLESYKTENAGVGEALAGVNSLKAIYDEASASSEDKKTIVMNDALLKKITDKVTEIRTAFIK